MARFFGKCVDGPWRGREIRADTTVLTIHTFEPDPEKPIHFAAGAYSFVHGPLGEAGEWRWRGREEIDVEG